MHLKHYINNIIANKKSSISIFLIIVAGSFSLFFFDSFTDSIQKTSRDHVVHMFHGHGQIFTKNYRETSHEKPWEMWIENWSNVITTLKKDSRIIDIFPRLTLSVLIMKGNNSIGAMGEGVDARKEIKFFDALNIVEGKNLDKEKNGIILGKGLAKTLTAKTGDRVTLITNTVSGYINGVDLIVTGIMYTGGKEFDDRYFRFQLERAHELLKTEKVESLVLGLSSHDIWDEIKTHVESSFPNLTAFSVDEIDKILFKQSEIWLDGQHKFLKLIIIIVILLGIFNGTSTAIFGRKKEVGILRANGDSVLNIIKQFTLEVFIISFFAALTGMFLVLILCALIAYVGGIVMPPGPGYTDYFIVVVKPSVKYFLGTLIISISCSVIATIFATLRTANLPTIKALKGI